LPFTVQDDDGVSHRGELIILHRWRPDLELQPGAAFTVVLSEEPIQEGRESAETPNVVVCAPACRVRLPAAIAEAAVAYGTDAPEAPPLRLPRRAIDAYAEGRLLAALPLAVTAQEVFGSGTRTPRFDSLVRELLAANQRAERYWRALDEALSWPADPPAQVVRPERVRATLRHALGRVPRVSEDTPGANAIERLHKITADAPPDTVAPSPGTLAEDVAFLRSLTEQPHAALQLAAIRTYLDGAHPGADNADLAADHAFTREQLSFLTLLEQPHQLDSLRATFEMFRAGYIDAYVKYHDAYWKDAARLRAALDELALAAQALARLNTLRALGPPLGEADLAAYERLACQPSACSGRDLAAALREHPACLECNRTLEDSPPNEDVAQVLRGLHAAVGRQQARLASEAVRRILARGGERLEQFLQVVQASDLAGLAQVLDDDLLAFLQELLSEPVAPTPEALDVFEALVRAYPVVSEEQIDALLDTLRQLLLEQIAARRTAEPSEEPTLHLASLPPSS
jgi:hypothetical protein